VRACAPERVLRAHEVVVANSAARPEAAATPNRQARNRHGRSGFSQSDPYAQSTGRALRQASRGRAAGRFHVALDLREPPSPNARALGVVEVAPQQPQSSAMPFAQTSRTSASALSQVMVAQQRG